MTLTYSSTSITDMNPDTTLNSAKRKLDDAPAPSPPKRTKTLGPFVMDDDDDDEGGDADSYLYNEPVSSTAAQTATPNTQSRPSQTKSFGPFAMDDDDDRDDGPNISLYTDSPSNSVENISASVQSQNLETRVGIAVSSTSMSASRDTTIESASLASAQKSQPTVIKTCSGKTIRVPYRRRNAGQSYEQIIASRSVTAPGRATKSYYGIDIHKLLDAAAVETSDKQNTRPTSGIQQSIEVSAVPGPGEKRMNSMWTEKYRARKFKDLIGDERTHRSVMRWLKGWDPVVFPGLAKQMARRKKEEEAEERQHRKVLLLTGPPGLGKTTLAHVCAKQAGYEVLEINASDERSRDVVKGRIRDAVGTENVKGMAVEIGGKKTRKTGKPVCVVVDEVDGVVTGSGGGEGGFMRALVDLLILDQKNSNRPSQSTQTTSRKGKKGDKFRLLRPIILICNDVYHPSLRPLRTSFLAEIIHVRSVPLEQVVQRTRAVFEKEGIQCDGDGVRKLCEACWGMSGNKDRGSLARSVSEGDIRGVMVTAEWIAHQLRSSGSPARLTRKWVEQHILNESRRDGPSKGLGRGGTKEIVERVFVDGAGFPYKHGASSFRDPFSRPGTTTTPVGVADLRKRYAIDRLREMVDAAGEHDRCITDCFLSYPTQSYQDDTILSKPNAAYDWLHFHDSISSRIFSHQDWELNPYLSQSVVAFHHLFASSDRPYAKNHTDDDEEEEHPFSGPRADFSAYEAEKQNRSIITEFRASLSAPSLRNFRSLDTIAMELVPNLIRMLAPDIKPVVVGGSGGQASTATVRKESERALVKAAVGVMHGVGVTFDKTRVEMETGGHGGFIYRMEPPIDILSEYSKVKDTPLAASTSSAPVRYAIRQVLEQEHRKEVLRRQAELRQKRLGGANGISSNGSLEVPDTNEPDDDAATKGARLNGPKRDFFGRIIIDKPTENNNKGKSKEGEHPGRKRAKDTGDEEAKVWVSYHEGFSNAVRKGVSMKELLSGL